MKDSPSVSVIIPVYKTEEYIEKCANSLFRQTLDNIEYIFIDDNSPDRSIDLLTNVLECFPKRKGQVRVIRHNANTGVSYVRNEGLYIANGEYIIYCDSDDYVDIEMYEKLYSKAKESNADIVGCDFIVEFPDKTVLSKQIFDNDPVVCINNIFQEKLHAGTCNKLIRRKLILDNNIEFPFGINLWEDMATVPRIFYYAKKIVYVDEALYHYIQFNVNSYTKTFNIDSINRKKEVITILQQFFENNPILSNSLGYLKLSVKLSLILRNIQEYSGIYRNADKLIWKHPTISRYNKLLLFMASNKFYCISNFLKQFKNFIKRH